MGESLFGGTVSSLGAHTGALQVANGAEAKFRCPSGARPIEGEGSIHTRSHLNLKLFRLVGLTLEPLGGRPRLCFSASASTLYLLFSIKPDVPGPPFGAPRSAGCLAWCE
ncbi:hypothetical protein TgHK011_005558 [Trichoderma gracile]|nr:hypothetical protein TgHK011_005558 [Trichoderma gracile]